MQQKRWNHNFIAYNRWMWYKWEIF